MGKPNSVITDYLQKKERIVSFCNYAVGEELFCADDVEDVDGFYSLAGKSWLSFMQRDILRRMKLKGQEILVGIENQQNVNLTFPVRQLGMDFLEYRRNVENVQVKNKKQHVLYTKEDDFLYHFKAGDRIIPILNLVLYWGKEEWKQPCSLQEMWNLKEVPTNVSLLLNDYKINVISVRKIPDEALERMNSDVKYVVGALKRSENRKDYKKYIEEHKEFFQKIPRSAAEVLNVCAKMNEKMVFQYQWDGQAGEEVVDMCKAWEDQYNDGVEEGLTKGLTQGRNQEKQEIIRNMLKMGMSDEIIRRATECGQWMLDKLKVEAAG